MARVTISHSDSWVESLSYREWHCVRGRGTEGIVVDQRPERSRLPEHMIELPRFNLPFPSDISPMTDSIIDHTSWWARAVGLVGDRRAVRRLRRNNIMHAGPRLVP